MSKVEPSLQSADLSGASAVERYLKETKAVCPFIEPAAAAGCLYTCQITPDCRTVDDIHPRLFEELIPRIERFRDDRRTLPQKQQRLLICHFVVFDLPAHLDADAVRLLNWPNWLGLLLKQLYTPKEIVFGFVRKNVPTRSTFGASIPAAPFHAVAIRSRVAGTDHRFFTGNQLLLQAMMEADDDGANVHASLLPNVPDIRDPAAIRAGRYFERLREWGQATLRNQ